MKRSYKFDLDVSISERESFAELQGIKYKIENLISSLDDQTDRNQYRCEDIYRNVHTH